MGQGNPTVILESGLGLTSADWGNVQPEVAKTARVCAYDRAGTGWSEPGPEPREARQISGELHALLINADIEGPYVLVGHSFGGLYARTYADRYPDGVASMVLVDSSHPEQFSHQPDGQATYEQTRRLYAIVPLLTRLGVVRLFDLNSADPGLPLRQRAWAEAFGSSTRQARATAEEFRAIPETFAQVRGTGSLGDKPLAVVSAGAQPPAWLELQEELAALSSNSSHRVVEGATHVSLLYDGRDAQGTSAAILEVVEAVHNDQPLAAWPADEATAK